MQTTAWKPWMPRVSAFAVGLLLAASAVFWMLHWPASGAIGTPALPVASDDVPAATTVDVGRLLGAVDSVAEVAVAPDPGSRFQLMGVVALGAGKGVALLAVDGQAAKPYRIGSTVDAGWVLQSVEPRSVALGLDASGPVRLQLALPQRPTPQ